MLIFSRVLVIPVSILLLAGCASGPATSLDQPPTGAVLVASETLIGSGVEVSVNTSTGAICGDDNVSVEVVQPSASTAGEFYEVSTLNVISFITAIRNDGDYEGFGLNYSASAYGLLDEYGNSTTDEILWLCFTPKDVASVNLANKVFLVENVLDMNTLGQDDVRSVYRD